MKVSATPSSSEVAGQPGVLSADPRFRLERRSTSQALGGRFRRAQEPCRRPGDAAQVHGRGPVPDGTRIDGRRRALFGAMPRRISSWASDRRRSVLHAWPSFAGLRRAGSAGRPAERDRVRDLPDEPSVAIEVQEPDHGPGSITVLHQPARVERRRHVERLSKRWVERAQA